MNAKLSQHNGFGFFDTKSGRVFTTIEAFREHYRSNPNVEPPSRVYRARKEFGLVLSAAEVIDWLFIGWCNTDKDLSDWQDEISRFNYPASLVAQTCIASCYEDNDQAPEILCNGVEDLQSAIDSWVRDNQSVIETEWTQAKYSNDLEYIPSLELNNIDSLTIDSLTTALEAFRLANLHIYMIYADLSGSIDVDVL